ncbi:MAG: bifunctional phosphopantothenoylcysteine decarboxylase/phosphopantothenate--cysteine ligase CoaBC [Methylococcales bacterium]|nr:bifunctional phosphopantothenoylcysteine decarboxylase/phosphopantothenate--cysteine ligase CoaBC [Methylococcales bacterium]
MPFSNRKILLAVTGGIAVYKALELTRLLKKQGADVRVVMTKSATAFVQPLSFQALSGHSVHSELLDTEAENAMGHIELARWADVFVMAPATANTLAKMAHGLADDLVSTLYLAATCPVYVAPAMNQAMWNHPATQANLKILQTHGVNLIAPESGEQACGEIGVGRMAEPETICRGVLQTPAHYDSFRYAGGCNLPLQKSGVCKTPLQIIITAGATREPLDPVRYLTNRSSGKMGYALAFAAQKAGANVTLISGVTHTAPPLNCHFIQVETAEQMHAAVFENVENCDIFIGAAAVADYRPIVCGDEKIKKNADQITLTLQKNPDILADVAALNSPPFTVGFAAETHNLEHYARDKLTRKKLNMIAANWVGRDEGGFERDENALEVFWRDGQQSLAMTEKSELARQLITLISERYYAKN